MSAHSTSPTTGRFAWLEPVKGLAIFMVIAYHVTLYLQTADVDAVLGRAKAVFELFPMPAFFLIAGIFAGRHGATRFRALWKRRLLPLLYLYLLWSVIRTLFYLIVPGLNGELGEIPATDPLALPLVLFWPSSSYWFLYALFLFTLGRWLIAGAPIWAQLAGAGLVSTLFSSGLVDAHNIGWNRVGALFFFFVLGAVFSREIRELVERARAVHLAVAFAALVASTALIVLGFRWVPLVVLIGQLAAVAVGILITRHLIRLPAFGIFTLMGRASLKLYLLHLYVIVSATALIGLLHPAWPRWVDVVVQVALVAFTVLASFGLARLTSRVRWLYAPPAFLRDPRRRGARPGPPPDDPEAAVTRGATSRPDPARRGNDDAPGTP